MAPKNLSIPPAQPWIKSAYTCVTGASRANIACCPLLPRAADQRAPDKTDSGFAELTLRYDLMFLLRALSSAPKNTIINADSREKEAMSIAMVFLQLFTSTYTAIHAFEFVIDKIDWIHEFHLLLCYVARAHVWFPRCELRALAPFRW